jgi:Ca2+-binding RTX toxin-like protein
VTFSTGTAGDFSETITLAATGSNSSGYSATVPAATLEIEGTVTGGTVGGHTFFLTQHSDTVASGAGDDTIIATSGTLSHGDLIDGGGGTNTLALQGPGTFNLRLPTTLTNVQIITAQEGQPADAHGAQTFAAQNQIVVLRDGLDATVNVSPAASIDSGDPKPPTITIVGARNADVINLASGDDVVTLGDAAESLNGGSGNDTIIVNGATIGATIDGGSGRSTLNATGGGMMAMGSNISNIANVLLSPAATAYNFTANAVGGLTIDDTSTATADTLTAGGANQTLTGGGAGKMTFVGSSAGGDTFKDIAALFNGDTIEGFANNRDVIDLTDVNFATLQPLAYVQNDGSSGTLTVSDGAHTAAITLFGQFVASQFRPASDGGAGTIITDPPPLQTAQLAPQHHGPT